MSDKLAGKVVLITGGGSGIGRAAAIISAREGARVVIADLSADGGEETAELIRHSGGEARFIRTDVSDTAEVDAAVAYAVDSFGRLDGAFNNAAIPEVFTGLLDATEETFARIMAVNVKGVWLFMRAEVRQMMAQGGGGAIVNTASGAGLRGATRLPIYSASKHAVIGLTKSAALEFAKSGPRINAVCPGAIETPMLRNTVATHPRAEAGYLASQPNRRFGKPDEVGEAVAWLLSDAASLITGVAMPVDGGMVA